MTLQEMHQQAGIEMAHIPKRPRPEQSHLRATYKMARMISLGKHAARPAMTASEVMEECLTCLLKTLPNSVFAYDRDFFKVALPVGG
jgi:hypothetical protein